MNFSSVTGRRRRAKHVIPAVLLVAALVTGGMGRCPAGRGVAEAAAPALDFSDTGGHWAEPAITLLAAKGVVAGFPGGAFLPGATLTRAQFAKLAVAGLQGSSVADMLQPFPGAFADLAGHWARGWVAAALERGLVRGYGGGLFAPDLGMNRAQVAAVLIRALGWEEDAQSLPQGSALEFLSEYADRESVPDWALGYVALAVQRGLLQGYDDGTLRPGADVTRAEAAALIARTLDRLALLYDIGGKFAAITPGGELVLDRIWGWPAGSGGTVSIETTSATRWLRNGMQSSPNDLLAGDRVLVVLGGPSAHTGMAAPALCVVSLAWDLMGQVSTAPGTAGEVTLQTPDGILKLKPSAGATVIRHGVPVALADLEAGDRVYAQVDPLTGEASYLDAVHVVAAGEVAVIHAAGEGFALDLAVAAGDESADRVLLAGTAVVFIDGKPAAAADIVPGMQVELAVPLAAGGAFGYAEAWTEPRQTSGRSDPTVAGIDATRRRVGAPRTAAAGPDLPPVAAGNGRKAGAATGSRQSAEAGQFDDPGLLSDLTGVGVSVAATGAPSFWTAYGSDGGGVRVAVVDTGVDPSHEILRTTSGGGPKIVDWVDLTGEGRVDTLFAATSFGGYVSTRLGAVRLGTVSSRSGTYRSGIVDEAALVGDGAPGVDLNGNGYSGDQFPLVLIDSSVPGVYDVAILDTDGDRDLRGETPLRPVRLGGGWTTFRSSGGGSGLGVALSLIDRLGMHVVLGFDANGHGTHVAGVAAGHDPLGALGGAGSPGMAPGAELLAIKALGSDGSGTWDDIRAGVEYAAANGAGVCVLAIEAPGSAVEGEYESIAEVAEDYGMLVFIAGGNSGPGLCTAASSPNDDVLVPVGGYVSREMWARLFGQDVDRDTVWQYNSSGPASSSGVAPLLLAPAAASSSVPRAISEDGYEVYEGTSMSAPHAAGAAALLIGRARAAGIDIEPRDVVRAMAAGARRLGGVSFAEQGFGVLDTIRAAEQLVPHGAASTSGLVAGPSSGTAATTTPAVRTSTGSSRSRRAAGSCCGSVLTRRPAASPPAWKPSSCPQASSASCASCPGPASWPAGMRYTT